MKLHPLLLLLLTGGSALAAPVALPGTTVYTQNFNGLAMPAAAGDAPAASSWTDDSTIAGWWLARAGNPSPVSPIVVSLPTLAGAAMPYRTSDGSVGHTVGNMYSVGVANAPDRFLATPPTTNNNTAAAGVPPPWGGEWSSIVIFQNTNATKALDLTNVKFTAKLRRQNNALVNKDSLFLSYLKGSTQAAITTLTAGTATAAIFPAAVATAPVSGYLTGWTPLPEFTYTSSGIATVVAVDINQPFNQAPASQVRVGPGEYVGVRWSNINDAGTDALLGFDDVELTWTEVIGAAVIPSVSGVVRNTNGTLTDPNDDTVEFDLSVAKSGTVSAGWTISAPVSLNTVTGNYTAATHVIAPISAFNATTHTLDITVEDDGPSSLSNATPATVTAPWTTIAAVVSLPTRADGAVRADPADDTWGFTLTVTGNFTGPGWHTNNVNVPNGVYTAASVITGIPIASSPLTFIVNDLTITTATANATATAPAFIPVPPLVTGSNSPTITFTPSAANDIAYISTNAPGTELGWSGGTAGAVNSNVQVQPAPAVNTNKYFHLSTTPVTFTTAPVDLNAVKGSTLRTDVKFAFYSTSASGLEADDAFNARVEIAQDGNFANTTPGNIITTYIKDLSATSTVTPTAWGTTNAVGTVYINLGSTAAPAVPFPSDNFTFHPDFVEVTVPSGASNPMARLVIATTATVTNTEHILIDDIVFSANTAVTITAVPGLPVWSNNGTVTAADDSYTVPVAISALNFPAGISWQERGNITHTGPYPSPAAIFGPYMGRANVLGVIVEDHDEPSYASAAMNFTAPAATLTATLVGASITRIPNGAGDGDDTVTFQLNITGTNGGPEFMVTPSVLTPSTLTATGGNVYRPAATPVTFTLHNVPNNAYSLSVVVTDASYPTVPAPMTIAIAIPAVAAPVHVIGQKNLGAGLLDVVSAGVYAPQWINFPSTREQLLNGGVALPYSITTSEVLDLLAIGAVNFTANLLAKETSAGSNFEDVDKFKAELLIDGGLVPANVINLISSYDKGNGTIAGIGTLDGLMNGFNGANVADYNTNIAIDEFNPAGVPAADPLTHQFALSYAIPASANSVQLKIYGQGAGGTEALIVKDVLFALANSAPVDTDGDGMTDAYESANGLNPAVNDAAGDLDGDGATNLQEFLAGTAANNPASTLKVTAVEKAGDNLTLHFPALNGKKYQVEISPGLTPAPTWTLVGTPVTATATGDTSITAPVPAGMDKYFGRVRVIP
jgi:hypothetical protein